METETAIIQETSAQVYCDDYNGMYVYQKGTLHKNKY